MTISNAESIANRQMADHAERTFEALADVATWLEQQFPDMSTEDRADLAVVAGCVDRAAVGS